MAAITANPDIDRLAGKAISMGLSRHMQAQPLQPPQPQIPFGAMESTPGYLLGEQIPDIADRHALLQPFGRYLSSLGSDENGPATLLGALGGGLAGAGLGYLRGSSPWLYGGTGALIGGLGSSLIGKAMSRHRHNQEAEQASLKQSNTKSSSYFATGDDAGVNGSEEMMDIQAKIFQDYSASSQIKSELIRLLQSLSPQQLSRVHSIVRGAAGAGIAYLLARYLLNLGVGGSTLMALLGGGIGMMSGGSPINAFGSRVNTNTNIFGQQRTI